MPDSAVAPTSVAVYGRAPTVSATLGARFNDSVSVGSTARSVTIQCSPQGLSDVHCDYMTTNVLQYAQGTSYNYFQLTGRAANLVSIVKGVALYVPQ
ncbi:MAG: hypothetical protein EON54_20965 [Alcaligenaceae bacterium]|nr:MAG: hypothetical protein EON54_20965 [Alcaligenaceae bacterium]